MRRRNICFVWAELLPEVNHAGATHETVDKKKETVDKKKERKDENYRPSLGSEQGGRTGCGAWHGFWRGAWRTYLL